MKVYFKSIPRIILSFLVASLAAIITFQVVSFLFANMSDVSYFRIALVHLAVATTSYGVFSFCLVRIAGHEVEKVSFILALIGSVTIALLFAYEAWTTSDWMFCFNAIGALSGGYLGGTSAMKRLEIA